VSSTRARIVLALAAVGVCLCVLPAGAQAAKAKASVVGGKPASLADVGFTVAILEKGRFICSGAVISPSRVVTAAHCVTGPATDLAVITGRADLKASGGQVIGVTGATVHPDATDTFRNDLAVLALASPTTAPPIQIATPEEDAATTALGMPLTIAGFGDRNPFAFGKAKLGTLFAATLFSRPGCKRYKKRFFVAQMICANGAPYKRFLGLRLMRSACPGDSGGPLIATTPGGPRLVGTVSFGFSSFFLLCAEHGFPGVFTRTSAYQSFLAPYAAIP
jgi:secreted trypsin-like serine protease